MLLECRHCGAPLDVRAGAPSVQCRYCDTQNPTQGLRTLAAETPRGWRPPPQWVPPAHVPADSQVPLRYHHRTGSAVWLIAGIAAAMTLAGGLAAALFVSSSARPSRPKALSGASQGGAGVDLLAPITLRERPEQLAKLPGATLSRSQVRVPLGGGTWDAITFEWDPAHPEHVLQFWINCPSPHAAHPQVRARLSQLLPRRFDGDHFRWEGVSLYYGAASGVLSVNVEKEPGNRLWKQQSEAMWSVVRVAALGLPGAVDPAAVRDYLGGGYPLTQLARLDFDADVDGSGAAVLKVFPGATTSKHIDLEYTIALAHPWLGAAELSWANKKGARLSTVHLRPASGTKLERQDELAQCVARGFGVKAEVNETDYLAKQRDYIFRPKGGGEIRVYDHLIKIELRDYPFSPPMPKASWEKALAVLDACGRT